MAPVEQITLYTCKTGPWAQRVEMALVEAGAEFTRYEIDPYDQPEWYASKVNPAKKVPAMTYGGPKVPADQPSPESIKLNESLVLVEFVADLFPESSILPKDPVKRAKARLFIDAIKNKLGATHGVLTSGENPEVLVEVLEHLQSLLPPEGFAIGEFSAADIALAPALGRLKIRLANDLGGWPAGSGTGPRILQLLQQPKLARFQKYWADLEARPSYKATFDEEFLREYFTKKTAATRAKKYGA